MEQRRNRRPLHQVARVQVEAGGATANELQKFGTMTAMSYERQNPIGLTAQARHRDNEDGHDHYGQESSFSPGEISQAGGQRLAEGEAEYRSSRGGRPLMTLGERKFNGGRSCEPGSPVRLVESQPIVVGALLPDGIVRKLHWQGWKR